MTTPYYSDEFVTLYHGDCLTEAAWLDADVLVTDPPYGIRRDRRYGNNRGPENGRRRDYAVIQGDRDTEARDAALIAWGGRPAMVFGTWREPRPADLRALLIWHKAGSFSALSTGAFFTNHEEVYVISGETWPKVSGPPLSSVITTTETRHHEPARHGHPTPKPVRLMETLIERCPPGVIADPFAGSGSTLVAAKQLGRRAVGVEIDEAHCETIAKRLAQDVLDFGDAS
jgi:DNA modification methylase